MGHQSAQLARSDRSRHFERGSCRKLFRSGLLPQLSFPKFRCARSRELFTLRLFIFGPPDRCLLMRRHVSPPGRKSRWDARRSPAPIVVNGAACSLHQMQPVPIWSDSARVLRTLQPARQFPGVRHRFFSNAGAPFDPQLTSGSLVAVADSTTVLIRSRVSRVVCVRQHPRGARPATPGSPAGWAVLSWVRS